jgi:signal peptidase I
MKRRPWIAFLLSFSCPGLGQMYNGQLVRAIVYLILSVVSVVAWVMAIADTLLSRSLNIILVIFGFLITIVISLEAAFYAKRKGKEFTPKSYNKWWWYLLAYIAANLAIGIPLQSILVHNVVQAFKVPSGAMENSVLVGDFILADKTAYRKEREPRQGDVVIFKYPGIDRKDYIKRCVAGPGQRVEIQGERLLVDGKEFRCPTAKFIRNGQVDERIQEFKSLVIPKRGDVIRPADCELRELLFLKSLIHQENPLNSVNVDFHLYIDNVLSDVRTIPTEDRTLGEKTEMPFVGLRWQTENWPVVDSDMALVKSAFPGHDVEIKRVLLFDGKPVEEYRVRNDNFFCMGDNRDNSFDSRYFGYVNKANLIGKAVWIYFSINSSERSMPFFERIRWERIDTPVR